MKKLLFSIFIVLLLPSVSFANVFPATALGQATGSTGSSNDIISVAIPSSADGYLSVDTVLETSSATLSGCVLDDGSGGGAQTMTQIGSSQVVESPNFRMYSWKLVAPTSGSRRVVCTVVGTTNWNIGAVFYGGVDQTTPTTDVHQGTSNSSPFSQLNTSDSNGSYQVGFLWAVLINSFTGGVNRQNVQNANDIGYMADSNALISNGSTNTFTVGWTGGVAHAGWITNMLRPATSTVATTFNFWQFMDF